MIQKTITKQIQRDLDDGGGQKKALSTVQDEIEVLKTGVERKEVKNKENMKSKSSDQLITFLDLINSTL